ncbi:MAG TPA: hypothetical protein VMY78_07165 [Solirubrobacteraceae bacterium]|nr:hypothetical protein [Solirubrobacteraceae bacterium]
MTALTAPLQRGARAPRRRPLTSSMIAGLLLLGGCGGDDEKTATNRPFQPATTPASTATATAAVPAGTVTTPSGTPRKATVRDARQAVDADRYADAVKALPALSKTEQLAVRRRIANRIARRARAALRRGNRSLVQTLLVQARRYPATDLTRQVRAQFRAAEARLAKADRERLLKRQEAARERRQRARAERAAEEARRAQRRRTTTTP